MSQTSKRTIMTGLRLGLETIEGVAVTLSDEDYVLLATPAVVSPAFLPGNEWGADPRSNTPLQHVHKSGASLKTTLVTHLAGPQANNTLPQGVDRLLRISGMRVSEGPQGARLYEPYTEGFPSATAEIFTHERRRRARGCQVSSVNISATSGSLATMTAELYGILDSTIDAAAPQALSADLSSPVKFDGEGFSTQVLDTFSPVVREVELSLDRDITTSLDANTAGCIAGFTLGRTTATMSLLIEATDLNIFNPYTLGNTAAIMPVRIAFRTGRRWWYFMSEQAQIAAVTDETDGSVALWKLTLALGNRYSSLSPCWILTAPVAA